MKEKELLDIIKNFDIRVDIKELNSINNGIINTTYVVKTGDKGNITKYLLQKINTSIFTEPFKLMKNIENVEQLQTALKYVLGAVNYYRQFITKTDA